MGIAGVMYPRQLSTGVVFNHTIKAETKRRVLSNTQLSAYEHRQLHVCVHTSPLRQRPGVDLLTTYCTRLPTILHLFPGSTEGVRRHDAVEEVRHRQTAQNVAQG